MSGNRITADVGHNLTIASVQDTSTYHSHDKQISASATFGAAGSASASYNGSWLSNDYASVRDQSGLLSGDGGYGVHVDGNTHLKGGIITSNAGADNTFVTGTLTSEDIHNHAIEKGNSIGVTAGISKQTSDPKDRGTAPQGPDAPLNTSETSHGVNHSIGFGHDHHHDESDTHSGIGGAEIQITDAAGQAATGTDISSIRQRLSTQVTTDNVAKKSGALENSFQADKEKEKLNAQVQVTQAFDKSRQEYKSDLHNKADELQAQAQAIRAKNDGKDTQQSLDLDAQAREKRTLAEHVDFVATAAYLGGEGLGHILAGEAATGGNDVYRDIRKSMEIQLQNCDWNAQNCRNQEVTLDQIKPGDDGEVHKFNNGIFNNKGEALVNAAIQNIGNNNEQGVYAIVNPKTGTVFTELLYVAYDEINNLTGSHLPLTPEEQTNMAISEKARREGFKVSSVDHSRGSDTDSNATRVLLRNHQDDSNYVVPIGQVVFFGAAANAQTMSDMVFPLSKGQGKTFEARQWHDLVGGIGGNAVTSNFNGGSMFDSAHSSYTLNYVPIGTMIKRADGTLEDIGAIIAKNWGNGNYSRPEYVMPTQLKKLIQQQKNLEH